MQGNRERTQEPTAANKTSSRSHAVLQIIVRVRDKVRDIKDVFQIGNLFLIDLAGSERAANTQNRGKRMVEGAHINRSLLALGNCINALSKLICTLFFTKEPVRKKNLLSLVTGSVILKYLVLPKRMCFFSPRHVVCEVSFCRLHCKMAIIPQFH